MPPSPPGRAKDREKEKAIKVWASDDRTGISIGINNHGELFIGGNGSGANLTDTPDNREYLAQDFKRYTGKEAPDLTGAV